MVTRDRRHLQCDRGAARAVMFLGTGSDVGKSIAATAFCRILKRRGYRVAPFKAQNMSNNSCVTVEGGEIGRAQAVQAEAAGILPSQHMNPVLLKPSTDSGSQIIIQGKVFQQTDATDYHECKPMFRRSMMESYSRLSREYDVIVMEGAGSCCEMNLKDNDLVNFAMAEAADAGCILVADIDRGGVFAQIIGTYDLMNQGEQKRTIGSLINKFRGDPGLFASGIDYIEEKTERPVLGLVPFYHDILIDAEDSVVVQEDKRVLRPLGQRTVNVAVVRLPAISNFTDLEILSNEPDVLVNYLFRPGEFSDGYDILILPGTKNVMEDALWLSHSGWKKMICRFVEKGGRVIGICGGYQLLGERVKDPHGVESKCGEVKGLCLLPIETILEKDKVVRRVTGTCLLNGKRIQGYEIHMGRTRSLRQTDESLLKINMPGKRKSWMDGWYAREGRVFGTYVHGLLDAPGFRGELLNEIREAKGLKPRTPRKGRLVRFHQYDRLADHFEAHCDVERIMEAI